MNVWDPFVRLFHWALVLFFFLAYYLEGDWRELHSHAGYTVALLVSFRIIWGFIGTSAARFANFVVPPRDISAYLSGFVRGTSEPHAGHDPAGAVMILVLLTSLLATTITGMSLFAMEGSGPLVGTFVTRWPGHVVEDLHEFFADFTVILVLVHVVGVLVTSRVHQQNLIAAMITGRKKSRP